MRRCSCLLLIGLALILVGTAPPSLADTSKIRLMTFNIRFDFDNDGGNRWEHRRDLVAQRILESRTMLVCLQEDKRHQIEDLQERLPDFEFVGRGRNASGSGERCAIAYHRQAFVLRESGDFWLSDRPQEPGSNTWGDKYPRKATWALLQARSGKRSILVINTHLTEGDKARQQAIRQKGVQAIHAWVLRQLGVQEGQPLSRKAAAIPVVIAGDFNSDAGGEELVKELTDHPVYPFRDAWTESPPNDRWPGTYGGFEGRTTRQRIDWILVGGATAVLQVFKINEPMEEGRFPSDHYPVVADLEFR